MNYSKIVARVGENTDTNNIEPGSHQYLERLIIENENEDLLNAFKRCAENGMEWNGEQTNANLFRIWLSSLQKQMNDDDDYNVNHNVEAENESKVLEESNGTSEIIDQVLEKNLTVQDYLNPGDQLFDNAPIIVDGNNIETLNFVELETFEDLPIGQIATVIAEGEQIIDSEPHYGSQHGNEVILTMDNIGFTATENSDVAAARATSGDIVEPSTSKSTFQILNEIRPIIMSEMKRVPAKKPSVLSST